MLPGLRARLCARLELCVRLGYRRGDILKCTATTRDDCDYRDDYSDDHDDGDDRSGQ